MTISLNPQRLLISYWLRLGSMSLKLFFLYPFYLEILYWRIIKFENKIFFFFFRLRETHNALQLSVFFSFFSSSFFCVIRNIEKFGAKNYFTDLRTTNTIYRFRDSVPVLEIHDCYQDMQKFEQHSISIQAIAKRREQCCVHANIQPTSKSFET